MQSVLKLTRSFDKKIDFGTRSNKSPICKNARNVRIRTHTAPGLTCGALLNIPNPGDARDATLAFHAWDVMRGLGCLGGMPRGAWTTVVRPPLLGVVPEPSRRAISSCLRQ